MCIQIQLQNTVLKIFMIQNMEPLRLSLRMWSLQGLDRSGMLAPCTTQHSRLVLLQRHSLSHKGDRSMKENLNMNAL